MLFLLPQLLLLLLSFVLHCLLKLLLPVLHGSETVAPNTAAVTTTAATLLLVVVISPQAIRLLWDQPRAPLLSSPLRSGVSLSSTRSLVLLLPLRLPSPNGSDAFNRLVYLGLRFTRVDSDCQYNSGDGSRLPALV